MKRTVLLFLLLLLMKTNNSWSEESVSSYKLVTQKFKGTALAHEYKHLPERVPKLLEHWLVHKMSSETFTVLERELYQEITEEFEFENKRKNDFDSSLVVKKLRRLGANVVLVGTIEQYAPSEEIIITAKIVSLETAAILVEWFRPINYRQVDLKKHDTLSGQLNRIAEELQIKLKEYLADRRVNSLVKNEEKNVITTRDTVKDGKKKNLMLKNC